jgi:glucose dehydrogenase
VANGVVYVGATDGIFYALNANTGALNWSYNTTCSGLVHGISPAVVNGLVYLGTNCGAHGVVALKASTGALVWRSNTAVFQDSSPAVANGLLYIGDVCCTVYAFNAASGALAWTYQIPTGNQVRSSPAVGNGIVCVVDNDGNLYALNARNGTFLWSYVISINGAPQGDSRQQYTYLTNGNFSANLECGNHLLWRFFRGFSVQRNAAVPAKIIPAAKLTRFPLGKRNAHCAAYMKMKNRAIGTAKLCSFNFGSPSFR